MKKRFIVLVATICLMSINIYSSDSQSVFSYSGKAKISPLATKLLHDIKTNRVLQKQNQKLYPTFFDYHLININDEYFAGALLKVKNNFDDDNLLKLGIKIGTKAGNIRSVKIPVKSFEQLTETFGIDYIQIDEPIKKKLDQARLLTNVDKVHKGEQLPLSYNGQNVVIGIIDGGFDYTNPTYYTSDGSANRIKQVWDQALKIGPPPTGYSYGREIKPADFQIYKYDTDNETHGTHVSGIAGGSGYGTNDLFTGMAPGCDFVLVSAIYYKDDKFNYFYTGQSNYVDAINYIFNYAASQNKPCVINMSLGTHFGPHDGTSLFDEACDALVGNGKILVGSAGNEGANNVHLQHTFSNNDSTVSTFIEGDFIGFGVDIWGQQNKDFCVKFYMYNKDLVKFIDSTDYYCTNGNYNLQKISLHNTDSSKTSITIYSNNSEFNSKPRFGFLYTLFSFNDNVMMKIKSTNGTIDAWNVTDFSFHSNSLPWAVNGDNNCSMGEIGGTGKNIISAGAYTSRHNYSNLDGVEFITNAQVNEIADFSSHGPTIDGRTKPDITAPGSIVKSAVNALDQDYLPGGYMFNLVVTNEFIINSENRYFAAFEGTSMSSPCVAGVVALMLQINPKLNPNQIKDILKQTATTDNFTGTIPDAGSNIWGWGKLNAYNAAKSALLTVNVIDNKIEENDFKLFPNPNNGRFSVTIPQSYGNNISIVVSDILGNIMLSKVYKTNENEDLIDFNLLNVGSGIYRIKFFNDKFIRNDKFIVLK